MSIMSRAAGEPLFSRRPSAFAAPLAEAIGDEYCDRCGASARHCVFVAYARPNRGRALGRLLFCTHHYRQHELALLLDGMYPL